MKDAVLLELANRWERDAKTPECTDGSPEAHRGNDIAQGRREGLRECADGIRMLIQLLGGNTYSEELQHVSYLKDRRVI